jgi:hypothetical protein
MKEIEDEQQKKSKSMVMDDLRRRLLSLSQEEDGSEDFKLRRPTRAPPSPSQHCPEMLFPIVPLHRRTPRPRTPP